MDNSFNCGPSNVLVVVVVFLIILLVVSLTDDDIDVDIEGEQKSEFATAKTDNSDAVIADSIVCKIRIGKNNQFKQHSHKKRQFGIAAVVVLESNGNKKDATMTPISKNEGTRIQNIIILRDR
mmetsp:Transcript_24417/g.27816  ORF Transcript_24417/g.27816 Transcript_24417/m.27816 type:complete len:123 (+) Transcript_24417:834-1202(+)